ncbi:MULTISPECIES: DUF4129 domain-containing protein [Flavobacterium]|uniref:DUF4129 domain-containing protein n=1 Tax=Flavobacterium jumunjinense TaxID=998845 RepID=A0ABV5GI13_9FLAO|nr:MULTISPECIES: DUF4129 domain-containing protein [Flavobacterium]
MKNKLLFLFLLITSIGLSQSEMAIDTISLLDYENYTTSTDTISYTKEVLTVESKTFEPNFQEKYKDKDFIYETVIDTKTMSAWDRFWKAVGNFISRLFDLGNIDGSISGLEIIMKIIAYGIVGFVIYMIVRLIIKKEGQWIFGKNKKKITVSEMVEENIHSIDFKEIIKKSKQENDYRLTIRYYYLWLLKSLTDKEVIEWDIEKTNSDYLYEIKSTQLKESFQYLSYIYDYSWYGEFDINEKDFSKAEAAFLKAIQDK